MGTDEDAIRSREHQTYRRNDRETYDQIQLSDPETHKEQISNSERTN